MTWSAAMTWLLVNHLLTGTREFVALARLALFFRVDPRSSSEVWTSAMFRSKTNKKCILRKVCSIRSRIETSVNPSNLWNFCNCIRIRPHRTIVTLSQEASQRCTTNLPPQELGPA
ncbi:uncharacterized protein L969DRAFT_403622 [Mixia osmundae IAM 14324]|uniref:uncharacterized protein n=1 Tax=Mixia osmundae (strain CBS 9802 / IAM 14324 / JCM 22182 / KY 12970) TaxID=764103 RepID=UPI0004A55105|nr:uncharacterized protein L969DRAFT_403622 [Mixia osmundae IAM 14324]KEI40109.1 hypothetical protein L969DRAFT_403622 [Mixia osmundae IAM 14324]